MIEKLFTAILPSIEHFHLLGYWVGFLAALLETALGVGLLLPGSTLLLVLGALSAGGYLDVGDLVWFAVAGAVLGDNINYWLGQRYGQKWACSGVWFLTPGHFEKARWFFDRHGARSVFLGRFIPSVKEIVPFIAGSVGMHYRTFLIWNVLGAIGWGLQWVVGGYLFGQSLKLAEAWMSRAGMLLVLVLAVWVLLWLVQRFVERQGREVWRVVVSLGRSLRAALSHNPYVRRWVRRHPHTVRFFAARVDRSHFYGLPLTLLALAFIYVLALFGGIVEDVVNSDPIVAVDHASAQLVAAFRAPSVIPPFVWIANVAAMPLVGAMLAVACLLLWLLNRAYAAAGLLLSTLGGAAFVTLSKWAFHRPRPVEAAILETSYSFPSGHATSVVAFYGFLGYLMIRTTTRWNVRVHLFFVVAGLVLLIGLSRILLGVHYLSDVWAGYLVGVLWLIAGISLNEWLAVSGRLTWDAPTGPRRKIAGLTLAAVSIAGLIGYAVTNKQPVRVPPPEPSMQLVRSLPDILRADALLQTTTLLGVPGQPLAFAIVAPDKHALIVDLRQAGWQAADKPSLRNMLRLMEEGLGYTTAPLAPAFWRGTVNDLAFERPVHEAQSRALATVRLWSTPYRVGSDQVFVGVAREYAGIRWGIAHTISPDVDAAADSFITSLHALGRPVAACRQALVAPMIGTYLMGDRFFTRGEIRLVDLNAGTGTGRLCGPGGAQRPSSGAGAP
ncbi:phosphatase PAP2 family protein [Pusillimonas sp. TS35]|uniref:bifunctional DedA family/phosphatase PAP2 family protein n=1 Tax=Paracandidimonas lactea TaxID=2895524 RepID=UPI00136D50F1|nr:phosphatase PAP2 family protein [Pusillimonas sp. TS35]